MIACDSLPSAILPAGISTYTVSPARAPYAAAEADVLPVDAQITARARFSSALEIAIVIPRSLKDPVGFAPSNFKYRSRRGVICLAKRRAGISGVLPSVNVTIGVWSVTGRN